MRPEALRYRLNTAICYWLQTKDNSKLKVLLEPMKKLWLRYAKEENDFRLGTDHSDYSEVYLYMEYISDRWQCAHRLRWIIDGIENGLLQ